jgi:diaminopimelate epimerase
MKFKFTKMHGCGNDFILLRASNDAPVSGISPRTASLCDRRTGIGADGIIFVMPSKSADFRMRIFNADGSEAEMCGNGMRCFARYVRRNRLSAKKKLTVETLAGPIVAEIRADTVRVTMGPPRLGAAEIPVALPDTGGPVIMHTVHVGDREFALTAVSMGNPHAVVYADELSDELVLGWGGKLESHPLFPRKTNVEFVKVLSGTEIRMRVYERGCGETLACGTGACAAVVAGVEI